MDTCAQCGTDLGVGRYCLNCGHRIGDPVPRHQQLLPWDEAHADHAPETTRNLRWMPWVAVAGGLVVLLTVLAWRLGSNDGGADDDGPGASTPGQSSSDEASAPRPRNLARKAEITVPATAPATNDLDGQLVSYEAERLVDGDPATAWRMAGSGAGKSITFDLGTEVEVVRVGLVNGYAKEVEGVDWYPHNRRVLTAIWEFDDGTRVEQQLGEQRQMQRRRVDPVTTRTVTLLLSEVSSPGPGELGRDYTAISEVVISGRPTG